MSLKVDIIDTLSAVFLSKKEEKEYIKSRAKELFQSDNIPTVDPNDVPTKPDYSKGYTTFSGSDVRILSKDEVLSTVQAITFSAIPIVTSGGYEFEGQGTLVFAVLTDKVKEDYERIMKVHLGDLTIHASDEFGNNIKQTLKECEVTNINYGISIDDLMSEIVCNFSFKDLTVPEYNPGQEVYEEESYEDC